MTKKNRPAEFPSDWHWERHHEDLVRGLAGAKGRLAAAEDLPKGAPYREQNIDDAKSEVKAVLDQLEHYGWGQQAASKRPREAKTKRVQKPKAKK